MSCRLLWRMSGCSLGTSSSWTSVLSSLPKTPPSTRQSSATPLHAQTETTWDPVPVPRAQPAIAMVTSRVSGRPPRQPVARPAQKAVAVFNCLKFPSGSRHPVSVDASSPSVPHRGIFPLGLVILPVVTYGLSAAIISVFLVQGSCSVGCPDHDSGVGNYRSSRTGAVLKRLRARPGRSFMPTLEDNTEITSSLLPPQVPS